MILNRLKILSLLILGSLVCAKGVMAQTYTANIALRSVLSGAEQVPAVATDAMGLASYSFNSDRTSLTVKAHFTGLSGAITGVHFHAGALGQTGPVVFSLMPGLNTTNGTTLDYVVSGITREQLGQFMKGQFYINVHTALNPNGEIRGQVVPQSDISFMAELNGAQNIPRLNVPGRGLALLTLSQDRKSMEFFCATQGIQAIGFVIHKGPPGIYGPVQIDLSSYRIPGTQAFTGRIPYPQGLLSPLMHDSIYVDIHTAANPSGEIRGPLRHKAGATYFDARLRGMNQVPQNISKSIGLMVMVVSPTMDTIAVRSILGDSLSSAITASHIHTAAVGQNGSVTASLEQIRYGNRHFGNVFAPDVTNALISNMLSGNTYINVHTTSFPNGEIRGQSYKTLREGYGFFLDGSQEVPALAIAGKGFAALSIDRDWSNLHYVVNWDDLTGDATGAHFHSGAPGETGPVIYNILATTIGTTTTGYWNATSSPPFSPAWASRLVRDSMYVNVHTTANPTGEIRGQVDHITLAVRATLPRDAALIVAPNPVAHSLKALGINEQATLTICTATGTRVLEARLQPGQALNASSLPAGLYFYQIATRKGQNTGKLVKL